MIHSSKSEYQLQTSKSPWILDLECQPACCCIGHRTVLNKFPIVATFHAFPTIPHVKSCSQTPQITHLSRSCLTSHRPVKNKYKFLKQEILFFFFPLLSLLVLFFLFPTQKSGREGKDKRGGGGHKICSGGLCF